jgi:hypothetical protein
MRGNCEKSKRTTEQLLISFRVQRRLQHEEQTAIEIELPTRHKMKHQHMTTAPKHEAIPKKKPARAVSKGNGESTSQNLVFGGGREELIRQVAYSLYEARSYEDGHSVEDWLQAEAQIDQMATPPAQTA